MIRDARARCALLLVLLSASACLPRGDAPAGRQILADQNAALVSVVPANGDGVLRVVFFRPGKDTDHIDLWVLSVDPTGGPPAERVLFTDLDASFEEGYRPEAGSTGLQSDSRGRLFLYRQIASVTPGYYAQESFRIDPVTGTTEDLGQASYAIPSASGRRVITYADVDTSIIHEDDGSMTVIDTRSINFLGDTAFYVTSAGDFMRFPLGGTAEPLATGVREAFPVNDHVIMVTKAAPDSGMTVPTVPDDGSFPGFQPVPVTGTLLDTTTLTQTPLPDGLLYENTLSFSSDGRWLIVNEQSQDPNAFAGDRVLVDTLNGTIETLGPAFQDNSGWRPGHDELWASPYEPDPSGLVSASSLSIKRPGASPVVFPGVAFEGFDDTGTCWFSRGANFNATESSDFVGIADDPTLPRFPVVPNGSALAGVWTLFDGRLLVDSTVGTDSFENLFVQVVDPRTGITQSLGEHGYMAAVGQTRALGLYNVSFLRGDLTTTDFVTGQSTVLAPEFAMAAVAEPQGIDAYSPGGRVVYQFRSRFESPWAGLWLATVP